MAQIVPKKVRVQVEQRKESFNKNPRRKRVLSENDWCEILKRAAKGESANSLAQEYNVDQSLLRSKGIKEATVAIRDAAETMVIAKEKINALEVIPKYVAIDLYEELLAISTHLASAAKKGAITANTLSGIALDQAKSIDRTNAQEGPAMTSLKAVASYTSVANEAAKLGTNLMSVKDLPVRGRPPMNAPQEDISNDPVEAARAYHRFISGQ